MGELFCKGIYVYIYVDIHIYIYIYKHDIYIYTPIYLYTYLSIDNWLFKPRNVTLGGMNTAFFLGFATSRPAGIHRCIDNHDISG